MLFFNPIFFTNTLHVSIAIDKKENSESGKFAPISQEVLFSENCSRLEICSVSIH